VKKSRFIGVLREQEATIITLYGREVGEVASTTFCVSFTRGIVVSFDAETIQISSRDLRRNPDDPLRKLWADARDLPNRCYTEAG
jgi:hypothetical protein